jgi:hypothetical protein
MTNYKKCIDALRVAVADCSDISLSFSGRAIPILRGLPFAVDRRSGPLGHVMLQNRCSGSSNDTTTSRAGLKKCDMARSRKVWSIDALFNRGISSES